MAQVIGGPLGPSDFGTTLVADSFYSACNIGWR
jgi:hypothetical protein